MLHNLNQPAFTAFSGVTLTAAYTGNRKTFETGGFSKVSIDLVYAMGAAEAGNTMEFQLEASSDGTNWHKLVIDTTGLSSVITPREWQMAPESLNVIIDVAYKYMRMSLKETGVAANFGTATVNITLSGL